MSSTTSASDSRSSSPDYRVIKGILFLVAGIGAGFATCWFVKVGPLKASVGELSTLLGTGTDADRGTTAGLESGIRSLQAERDAAADRARKLENEQLPAAAKEREALSGQLEAARGKETEFATALSQCQEAQREKDDALAKAQRDLDGAEQARSRAVAERDALERAKAQLEEQLADSVPLPRVAAEAACIGPSALARRAQSATVRQSLSPLLAKGSYQPSGRQTVEPSPFSFREIRDAGALDGSNPESLYHLWRIVAARENDRADKWPSYWAPSSTDSWLPDWYAFHGGDAIPALHRAQRLLAELGPVLVWMRMLAP